MLRELMQDVDAPRGVAEFGYGENDIPALVDGALKQQRLLAVPRRRWAPTTYDTSSPHR